MAFEIKILKSLEEVEKLRGFWTALKSDPESDLDFVSFIIRSRPEILRPYVVVAYQDGEPVSLVAGRVEDGNFDIKIGYRVLWRTKIRRISIFYGGFMGRTEGEIGALVVRRLLQSLREEKADMLLWSGIRRDGELQRLLDREPNILCRDRLSRAVPRWLMSLPDSLEELVEKRMSKKHRYWVKRTMRLLEKDFPGGVRIACHAKPEEMGKFFGEVIAIAKKTYQWGLGVGFQDNPEQRNRLMLEAGKGWLRGYILYLKDEPAAFWITSICQDTAYSEYTGYNPEYQKHEIGTVLFMRMLGDLCQEKVKQLDFGPGTALYKERFGDSQFMETTYCVFAPSGRGMFLNSLRLLIESPLELARSALKRLGLEQKLKKAWRSRAASAKAEKTPVERQADPANEAV